MMDIKNGFSDVKKPFCSMANVVSQERSDMANVLSQERTDISAMYVDNLNKYCVHLMQMQLYQHKLISVCNYCNGWNK